jgi:glycosidase
MFILEKQVQENKKYFKDPTLCGIFLDNHDQDRFLNHTQNPIRIQNALVYLMFSDEIPIVYMGIEQNFTGNPYVTDGPE